MKHLNYLGRASETTRSALFSTVQADNSKIVVNGVKYRAQPNPAPLPPQYPQTQTQDPN